MLMHGVGFFTPTRLQPEATRRFAVPFGSVHAAAQLVTERMDNARLEGLGCPCDRKVALGSFGVDEDLEQKAVTVGFLEQALPRLQAAADAVKQIPPPTIIEQSFSSTYWDQFAPLQKEVTSIISSIPPDISDASRATIVGAGTAFQQALIDTWSSRSYSPTLLQIASAGFPAAQALYMVNKDEVDAALAATEMEAKAEAAAAAQALKDALKKGRDALAGALDMGKWIGLGLAAILAFALYGRVRG